MNRSTAEIRLDLVILARDVLTLQFNHKVNALNLQASRADMDFDIELVSKLAPTAQEIIAFATELNKFVEDK